MKINLFSKLIVALMISLTLIDVVKAGEAKTIPISVTIPVIPGVNTSAIQQETVRKSSGEELQPSQSSEVKNTSTIQEDKNNTMIAKADDQTVRTIYSR